MFVTLMMIGYIFGFIFVIASHFLLFDGVIFLKRSFPWKDVNSTFYSEVAILIILMLSFMVVIGYMDAILLHWLLFP